MTFESPVVITGSHVLFISMADRKRAILLGSFSFIVESVRINIGGVIRNTRSAFFSFLVSCIVDGLYLSSFGLGRHHLGLSGIHAGVRVGEGVVTGL
jgi:hypothetical protein